VQSFVVMLSHVNSGPFVSTDTASEHRRETDSAGVALVKSPDNLSKSPETISEILERWTARQAEWARLRVQLDGAALAGDIVADLERIAQGEQDDDLTLTAAAAISGYSTEHLGRLLRHGVIPNAGRKHSPRIRRSDLPIRPKRRVANVNGASYDVVTDARFLRVRR
jgi:hypothetical protein